MIFSFWLQVKDNMIYLGFKEIYIPFAFENVCSKTWKGHTHTKKDITCLILNIFNVIWDTDSLWSNFHYVPSGMEGASSTHQRTAPRRPSPANTERRYLDHHGTKRTSLPSWGVSSVGCSFWEGRGNHGALTEASRTSREAMKKTSAGQVILGKVRQREV